MMNAFEKQAKLGRELFEVNSSTVRKLVELCGEELRKVWELNQEFAQKLPEVRDISTFVEMQREYGQSVWEGVKTSFQSRGEIVKRWYRSPLSRWLEAGMIAVTSLPVPLPVPSKKPQHSSG